jgi:hypothetical protein
LQDLESLGHPGDDAEAKGTREKIQDFVLKQANYRRLNLAVQILSLILCHRK